MRRKRSELTARSISLLALLEERHQRNLPLSTSKMKFCKSFPSWWASTKHQATKEKSWATDVPFQTSKRTPSQSPPLT